MKTYDLILLLYYDEFYYKRLINTYSITVVIKYSLNILMIIVDYAKSERQFRVNGAAVPFPTAHQRRSLFIDFITLAHAYSVHSFQDGKNAFCQ